MTLYRLTRTLPDGTVKTNPTALRTLREVEFAVSYCLMDNSRVPRGEARRFAASLTGRPLGEPVRHESSGYAFRVDRV
ncbi:hypothetical protein ACH4F6_38045 [Streptomyces sp. NPDC017936]|uniref:hypothetical protein n=1 Tax=Streptomyces sp. NPDC017936 TaxID=3365016 RepID=UPI00378E9C8B